MLQPTAITTYDCSINGRDITGTIKLELERMGRVLFILDQPHLELIYCWYRDIDLILNPYMESVDLQRLGLRLNQDQMNLLSFGKLLPLSMLP